MGEKLKSKKKQGGEENEKREGIEGEVKGKRGIERGKRERRVKGIVMVMVMIVRWDVIVGELEREVKQKRLRQMGV
ncbi:hypothetical protein ACE4V3_06290 (plasmid) [Borrelia recurrentis]|uniref:hypothetical protein n=1 Tax=Borrelia recurrentis TaxID=44449 RepID=UPI00030ACAD3